MNNRKREKPYHSRHSPYSLPKRRRPLPLDASTGADPIDAAPSAKAPTSVVVIGVPVECSVLELKSRFEMYGPISRTRMDPDGVAHINFRSNDAARSAVDAAQDSSFPITLHSVRVQVMWASSDSITQWKGGVGRRDGLASKLVRPEVPLSRHGRGIKLGSAIVNPRDENNIKASDKGESETNIGTKSSGVEEGTFKGREIVAYDDIL